MTIDLLPTSFNMVNSASLLVASLPWTISAHAATTQASISPPSPPTPLSLYLRVSWGPRSSTENGTTAPAFPPFRFSGGFVLPPCFHSLLAWKGEGSALSNVSTIRYATSSPHSARNVRMRWAARYLYWERKIDKRRRISGERLEENKGWLARQEQRAKKTNAAKRHPRMYLSVGLG